VSQYGREAKKLEYITWSTWLYRDRLQLRDLKMLGYANQRMAGKREARSGCCIKTS